jgi:hypothetical protein
MNNAGFHLRTIISGDLDILIQGMQRVSRQTLDRLILFQSATLYSYLERIITYRFLRNSANPVNAALAKAAGEFGKEYVGKILIIIIFLPIPY